MKLIKCKICGKEHQGRVCSSFTRSTVSRDDKPARPTDGPSGGYQAATVDTIPVQDAKSLKVEPKATAKPETEQLAHIQRPGHPTPKPKFNKTAYMKSYMADLRAAKKIGITIREYRERKRDDVSA
jgi:hypothetical protein